MLPLTISMPRSKDLTHNLDQNDEPKTLLTSYHPNILPPTLHNTAPDASPPPRASMATNRQALSIMESLFSDVKRQVLQSVLKTTFTHLGN
jgi:hypothetical protein